MGDRSVTLLWLMVGALFLLTVVSSKPISLNTAADVDDSAEANSSEEAANEEVEEVEEPELPETTATDASATEPPVVAALTDPPATIALPVFIDATALPTENIDLQTSSGGMQMLPDPSQPSVGVDLSPDVPQTDPALDQITPNADVGVQVAEAVDLLQQQTNEVQRQEILPTQYPPHVQGKVMHVSLMNAVPVHVAEAGMPVCFTFHTQNYAASQHNPQYNPQHKPPYDPQYDPQHKPPYDPQYHPQYKPQYDPQYNPQYQPQYQPQYDPPRGDNY